jgi:hypothetical protein
VHSHWIKCTKPILRVYFKSGPNKWPWNGVVRKVILLLYHHFNFISFLNRLCSRLFLLYSLMVICKIGRCGYRLPIMSQKYSILRKGNRSPLWDFSPFRRKSLSLAHNYMITLDCILTKLITDNWVEYCIYP